MRDAHSLKEMIAVRAIVLSRKHAAPLETDCQIRMDMDHFGQAFQATPFARSPRGHRV
jgi:hypothetical protein